MHQVVERCQKLAALLKVVAESRTPHVPAVAGQDRLLAVELQVIDHLRDDDVGEQSGSDAALGDRLGWQDRLGDLWVVTLRFARPAGVGGPGEFADED